MNVTRIAKGVVPRRHTIWRQISGLLSASDIAKTEKALGSAFKTGLFGPIRSYLILKANGIDDFCR